MIDMHMERATSVIALIIVLVLVVAVTTLALAGCAMAPTVTPVAVWPTLPPPVVGAPTDSPVAQAVVPTPSAVALAESDERNYPLPTVPTSTPDSYPSPGVATAATTATVSSEPTRSPVRGRANVDEVQVNIMESMPVQVSLTVHGFLPDGCTQLASIEQSRGPEGLVFDAVTEKDPDATCTQALVPFEEVVVVDLQDLGAGVYVIDVNGVTTTLKLEPSMLAEPEPVSEACPEPGEGTLLYRSASHGYCFLYSDDMEVTSPQPQVVVVNQSSPGQTGVEGDPLTIMVEQLDLAMGRTLSEVVENRLSTAAADTFQRAQIEFGGELAVRVESVAGQKSVRQVYVMHQNSAYLITAAPYEEALWSLFASSFTFQ